MVEQDEAYLRMLLDDGVVRSPCLEAGAGEDSHTVKPMLARYGVTWFGTDLRKSRADLYAVDLEASPQVIAAAFDGRRFASVLLMNVIEHVFDPVRVLDNVFSLVEPGGHCVVVAPTVWPVHYYPLDCWRVNPNLFEEYAKRRGHELLPRYFNFVSPAITPVDRDADGNAALPPPTRSRVAYWKGRAVHRAFNTYGRGANTPSHVSVGAVFKVKG